MPTDASNSCSNLVEVVDSVSCCDDEWENAYRQFETPEQEILKFMRRLQRSGALQWDRDGRIVDLFCGRGNGLVALERLGFRNLSGVDLSKPLLLEYEGPATCFVADCRELPFDTESCDVVIVQGGLHHLPTLPDDLQQVVSEIHRVLVPGGRTFIVEPWQTPFLDFVHAVTRWRLARAAWSKIDALASMIDRERTSYENWLGRPDEILRTLRQTFVTQQCGIGWGKLVFIGEKATRLAAR